MSESLVPEAELREEFARRRMRQIILVIPVLIGMATMFWLEKNPEASIAGLDATVLAISFFILVVGAIAFSLYNWRCPSCSGYLGKAINPKFCSKCGFNLRP